MTKQEIKDLIAAKIAGQGNQVDIGNALAEVLNALADNVDAAQQAANNIKVLDLTPYAEQLANNIPIPETDELIGALSAASAIKFNNTIYPLAGMYSNDTTFHGFYERTIESCPAGYIVEQFLGIYGSAAVSTVGDVESCDLYIPALVLDSQEERFIWFALNSI